MDFSCIGMGAVGSLAATTLENNKKFRSREWAENGFAGRVGGGDGTGSQPSLGSKPLIINKLKFE
jgi:hypothetical protein